MRWRTSNNRCRCLVPKTVIPMSPKSRMTEMEQLTLCRKSRYRHGSYRERSSCFQPRSVVINALHLMTEKTNPAARVVSTSRICFCCRRRNASKTSLNITMKMLRKPSRSIQFAGSMLRVWPTINSKASSEEMCRWVRPPRVNQEAFTRATILSSVCHRNNALNLINNFRRPTPMISSDSWLRRTIILLISNSWLSNLKWPWRIKIHKSNSSRASWAWQRIKLSN